MSDSSYNFVNSTSVTNQTLPHIPTGEPLCEVAEATAENAANVSWKAPTSHEQNGVISNYQWKLLHFNKTGVNATEFDGVVQSGSASGAGIYTANVQQVCVYVSECVCVCMYACVCMCTCVLCV